MIEIILIILIALFTGYYTATGTKSQIIRLIDVFFIGPLMIDIGIRGYESSKSFIYLVLIFLGASTTSYNLRNYIIINESNSTKFPE